jgi:hypothetical protein
MTKKKLLEKYLSLGTDKTIGDRRISLQAALTAVPSFCPTDTGILWKLYDVCLCVCVCVCMKENGLYMTIITTISCCKCICKMMCHYKYCIE